MGEKQANPPRRHHFAPVFFLKRWTGEDGCIEQFSRPAGRDVKARRLAPGATGYRDDLYRMPGLSEGFAQQVEARFMQAVDDGAARVLDLLETGAEISWTSETRSAWTRLLQSLQLRTPADIAGIKERTRSEWGKTIPLIQATYESLRRAGDPVTFEEFVTSRDPLLVERAAMKIATVLIDSPRMGELINNMRWAVLDLSASPTELLISDRPVQQVLGLGHADAFMTLPIGPKRLFVAANGQHVINKMAQSRPRELVQRNNRSVVSCARQFVWARDRRQAHFVAKWFGAAAVKTLGERLAEMNDTTEELIQQPPLARPC